MNIMPMPIMDSTQIPSIFPLPGKHNRRYKTKQAKSCIRGSIKALLAFAELPHLHHHPRVQRLIDYFLGRGGIFNSLDRQRFVNKDMQRPSFPITWGPIRGRFSMLSA